MHHARDHALLGVRRHHDAEEEDNQGGDGVHAEGVGLGLVAKLFGIPHIVMEVVLAGFFGGVGKTGGVGDGGVEQVADADGFDEHAAETTADEENGDGEVLKVLRRPFAAPVTEMLQKDVGSAVRENQGTLDKLGRRAPFLASCLGAHIPSPTNFTEAAGPTPEGEDTQPEENAALDPVSKTREDAGALEEPTEGHDTGAQRNET